MYFCRPIGVQTDPPHPERTQIGPNGLKPSRGVEYSKVPSPTPSSRTNSNWSEYRFPSSSPSCLGVVYVNFEDEPPPYTIQVILRQPVSLRTPVRVSTILSRHMIWVSSHTSLSPPSVVNACSLPQIVSTIGRMSTQREVKSEVWLSVCPVHYESSES